MTATLKKLNFKNHQAVYILNAPASFRPELMAIATVSQVRETPAKAKDVAFVLAFATLKKEVDTFADAMAKVAISDAVVWVAYPKQSSKKYKCEFHRDSGWDRFGTHGFEPVRMVAIDQDWSALRFRRVEHIKAMTRSFAISEAGASKAGKKPTALKQKGSEGES